MAYLPIIMMTTPMIITPMIITSMNTRTLSSQQNLRRNGTHLDAQQKYLQSLVKLNKFELNSIEKEIKLKKNIKNKIKKDIQNRTLLTIRQIKKQIRNQSELF